jgi:glycerol-3-phosphate dehydrogenase
VLRTPTNRLFFVIPWRGCSLIGTTDTRYEGNPDEYKVSRSRVLEFIDEVNAAMPSANLTIDEVQWTYGGLRPIVETETAVKDVNKASRRYEIHDHQKEDGVRGFVTVIGGKYTTSRALAEKVVELAAGKLNSPIPARMTAGYVLPGGRIGSWAGYQVRLMREFELPADDAERWVRTYGNRSYKVISAARGYPPMAEKIDPDHFETMAVVDMAVNDEMALTLQDVLFRRTGLGTMGRLSDEAVRKVALRMGTLLGWKAERIEEECRPVLERLRQRGMGD